ncbi:YrbL family protein, partial [Salmonella enterica subsp. enterica serovar Anatum]|nr:YrbL family protein [Salmonella enterica subsp. enterica serovar Anatum]
MVKVYAPASSANMSVGFDVLGAAVTPVDGMRRLLKKLKRYLLDNHIVTMSLKPQNILCQRISESEVVPVVC